MVARLERVCGAFSSSISHSSKALVLGRLTDAGGQTNHHALPEFDDLRERLEQPARGEVLAEEARRTDSDTRALHRRLDRDHGRVEGEHALGLEVAHADGAQPDRPFRIVGHVDERHALQVIERLQLVAITTAAERRQDIGKKLCGMQFRLRLHREADGAVEILASEIDAPLRRRHAHFDLGMLGLEAMQARRQPAQSEGRDQADIERAGVGLAADALQRVGHAVEGIAQVGQQRLAFAGDLEPARTAHEQRHAQPLLERLHLVADRRLGDVQLLGGVGEGGVAGGGFEGAERVQRQLRAAHLRHRRHSFCRPPPSIRPLQNALP